MDFEKRKAVALAALSDPGPDKSPKGTLDAPIIPLIDALNLNTSYFTTSSCSGRISLLSHPSTAVNSTHNKNESSKKKKAGGGGWIFVTHDPADPETLVDLLFRKDHHPSSGFDGGGVLVFRFEPLIIAVECRDATSAQFLVSTAISCGFRESGVTSLHKRVMVAIRCSIRLEVPLGEIGQVLVSPEYIRYLVGIANEKMEANRRRTQRFLLVLKCKVPQGSTMVAADSHQGQESSLVGKGTFDFETDKKDVFTERSVLENDGVTCTEPAVTYIKDVVPKALSKSSTWISNHFNESEVGHHTKDKTNADFHKGLSRVPGCCLTSMTISILGEPVDKLFLWGQSACTLSNKKQNQILIFGGFGGLGRHARRNDSLMLNPHSGLLKGIDAKGPPSPRVGHTSSVVGEHVFVIGGREGPLQILNDVWILDTVQNKWMLVECTGSVFQPRHRHAAAVIGSNIYIFGGLKNEVIYSCMHVLNTITLQWNEVKTQGEWPCARHSHSMVAYGPQIFMFGGYDGERALGDLHIFDVGTFLWKNEKASGRAPFPRFSHSMFVYRNYIGVIGGCPISQHHQDVALLDMPYRVWKHMIVDSVGTNLWVRSSTIIIDDDLVIVGGGVSCYAFGAKFNPVMKINLHPLLSAKTSLPDKKDISITQCNGPLENQEDAFIGFYDSVSVTNKNISTCSNHSRFSLDCCESNHGICISERGDGHDLDSKHLVLRLEKKYAKLGKDILKAFEWLDLGRRVEPSQDGVHICLPISYALCLEKTCRASETDNNFDRNLLPHSVIGKGISVNNLSPSRALSLLLACGFSIVNDDKACSIKLSKSPQKMMRDAVCSLIKDEGLLPQLLEQLPTRWERLGDIVVLPATSFRDPIWNSIGYKLWHVVAKLLGANRLARQGPVLPTGTRDSTLEILVGGNDWVTHHENGIVYSFDATKCMFSFGNLSEKLRIAQLDCRDEIVVDLFAGIGYFVLPFLVKAKAKLVYACEWNPHALEALRHSIKANYVADRCIILEGDNRVTAPKGVADRVCLGLLPTSESSWLTAVKALRTEGGTLHVHGNVTDSEEGVWSEYVSKSIHNIAKSEGYSWDVSVQHLERVKWYGPHIRHLVADIRCKNL